VDADPGRSAPEQGEGPLIVSAAEPPSAAGAPAAPPRLRCAIVIPALDEEASLPAVLAAIDRESVDGIVVVDNGSSDRTAEVAARCGARVTREPQRGYGAACLQGIALLRARPPEVVVFLDADGSDDPAQLLALMAPIARDEADLVIGSRVLGGAGDPDALTPAQRFGNRLATALLGALFGVRASDLGPFRAIRWEALERLGMRDRDYGWTVEMQARAARAGMRCVEIPVRYRRRSAGRSKVAGTLSGATMAGVKILWTIAKVRLGG